jgi:uncharacterized membrane protein YqjE
LGICRGPRIPRLRLIASHQEGRHASTSQRSVPEVLQDIIGNIEEIIRSEFRLTKTELSEKASNAAQPAKTLGVGLLLGFYGLGFLLLAAVYGLAVIMSIWLAALIVGAVLAIIASIFISSGATKLKRLHPTPDKTIQSMEENVQWAKNRIK